MTASDSIDSSDVEVTVTILDINDNSPIFNEVAVTIVIPEVSDTFIVITGAKPPH